MNYFVAIDIGASETRFTSNSNNIYKMPNNRVILDGRTLETFKPNRSGINNSLELELTYPNKSKKNFLYGSLAERYSTENERPSMLLPKSKQDINYTSILTAASIVCLEENKSGEFDLFVAVPPNEIDKARDTFNDELPGLYSMFFAKLNKTIEFKINKVVVYEESYLSALSFFFGSDLKPRKDQKPYLSGNVLSLDIGASTTDLTVIQDGRYLERSGRTYKTGGNVVRDYLITSVGKEYEFDLNIKDAEVAVASGLITVGDSKVNIGKLVDDAKKKFAVTLSEHIQQYFKSIDISLQSVRAVIVSGGGAKSGSSVDESKQSSSESMSFYITEQLKKVCSTISVLEHPLEDIRTANIHGLYIMSSLDEMSENGVRDLGN